jgi:hypothetical protein
MKRLFAAAVVIAGFFAGAAEAGAVQPYVMFEAGVVSRDVVEEDASIAGFSYEGRADSTRALATVGVDLNSVVAFYAQVGGADLAIDEFNSFDSSFEVAYGAGVRLNFLLSPHPYALKLFVDASFLHTTAKDTVQAPFGPEWSTEWALIDEEIEWNEYAVLMGAGSRYGPYGPYGGIRLSFVDATDKLQVAPNPVYPQGLTSEIDLKEQDNFGVFFGTDIFLDRAGKTSLNFEISLFDQESFRAAIRRAF